MALKRTLVTLIGAAALSQAASTAAKAQSFDMDCKVILCIAGGFPAGCGDAYSYMIDRITQFPPLPPFGYCAMSDGTQYSAYDISYAFPSSRSAAGYYCPETHHLYFDIGDDDGRSMVTAFCYTGTSTRSNRDEDVTVYLGQIAATPINYQMRLVLEPGTAEEYDSGMLLTNWRTGFITTVN